MHTETAPTSTLEVLKEILVQLFNEVRSPSHPVVRTGIAVRGERQTAWVGSAMSYLLDPTQAVKHFCPLGS